ncbi:Ppx/GppA phosphatase family protein [Ruminococcus callidus]
MAHDGPGVIESLPIGSLTLAKEYVGKVFPKQSECEKIQVRIRKELKKRKLHRLPAHTSLCGVGGTARSLLLLAQEQQELPDTQRLLTAGQLKKLEKLLWKKDNTARELLLKNCPDRLHTIYTGMLILDELVELSQCETIYISQYGVREGYLRRELARKRKA